jgi:F0F1-type ATP synthase membrane subunit a
MGDVNWIGLFAGAMLLCFAVGLTSAVMPAGSAAQRFTRRAFSVGLMMWGVLALVVILIVAFVFATS